MIRLIPDPTFDADVSIAIPGAESPVVVKFTFRALERGRVLSLLMVAQVIKSGWLVRQREYLKLCLRAGKMANAIDLLDELIVSWQGFDIEYSKHNLSLLLAEYPDARSSIFFSYFSGLREAKLKN